MAPGQKIVFTGASYANMPAGERLLYERGCVSCHSLENNKMMGPPFKGLFGSPVVVTTAGVQRTVSRTALISINQLSIPAPILCRIPNTMPPSKDVVSEDEIGRIISYLKGLK